MAKANFQSIIAGDKPVLVDFWAEWCGPCKAMAPVLKEFAQKYPEVKVVKINVDNNQALAARERIRSIPTLSLYKNGQSVWRQPGAMSLPQLEESLRPHIQ